MGVALTAALIYTFLRLIFFDGAIHYDDHRVTSPIFSPDIIHLWSLEVPTWANSAMLILDTIWLQRHLLLHATRLLQNILR